MTTKKKPAPLRDQILDFLRAHDEATLKQIAAATTERDYPSRVTTELNKLRTEAVVECEKKKGKNELWYWLAQATTQPQPAVGKNAGSSASVLPSTPAEGAAVQPEPAPEQPADVSQAAPVAEDETYSLLSVLADIRAVVGDPEGRLMQDELVERVRTVARAGATANADLDRIREVLGQRIHIGDPEHRAAPVKCAELAAELIDSLLGTNQDNQNLIAIASEKLAPLVPGYLDTSDMDLDEIAERVSAGVDDLNARMKNKDTELLEKAISIRDLSSQLANQNALVAKLEHLLQSARNEAEHLRRHADAAGADMVNHPPHYQGKVECIDAIEAALGPDGFRDYCRGNALKYTFRAGKKGDAAQDMAKAAWYIGRITAQA